MALSTTPNYSLRKHDAGDLNWDVDMNWNMTKIDTELKAVNDAVLLKADKTYVDALIIKQDTTDGKTYKAVPSFTNGVLSWTVEEVV